MITIVVLLSVEGRVPAHVWAAHELLTISYLPLLIDAPSVR